MGDEIIIFRNWPAKTCVCWSALKSAVMRKETEVLGELTKSGEEGDIKWENSSYTGNGQQVEWRKPTYTLYVQSALKRGQTLTASWFAKKPPIHSVPPECTFRGPPSTNNVILVSGTYLKI